MPSIDCSQQDFFRSFANYSLAASLPQAPPNPSKRKVKPHGFIGPFHPLQISAWVFFPLDCLAFCLMAPPLHASLPASSYSLFTCFALLTLLVVLLTAVTGRMDPTDPTVNF